MHRKSFQHVAAFVLFLVLVAGEALAVVHSVDLDAHTSGDGCKICITVADLGSALPAKAVLAVPPRSDSQIVAAHGDPVAAVRAEAANARGPPHFS
jgi:hypothetical protein